MDKEKKMFFTFSQNNSGGYFVTNLQYGVSEYVIIEAEDSKEAWDKLCEIGENVEEFWDYCDCCGDRWYESYCDQEEFPAIYGDPVQQFMDEKGSLRGNAHVHYADGTMEHF